MMAPYAAYRADMEKQIPAASEPEEIAGLVPDVRYGPTSRAPFFRWTAA